MTKTKNEKWDEQNKSVNKKDVLKIINLYSGGRPPRRNWDVFPSAPQINSSQNRLLMGYYSSSASLFEDDCSECSTDG